MKKVNISILTLSTLLLLSSCNVLPSNNDPSIDNQPTIEANQEDVIKEIKKADTPTYKYVIDENFKEFLPTYQEFASKMAYEYVDSYKEDENISISPLSIYMALAMANKCSDNETEKQISNALNTTTDKLDLNMKSFLDLCYKEYYEEDYLKKENVLIASEELSNSIWFNNALDVKEDCLQELASNYYVDSYYADFSSNPTSVSKEISKFIENKTKGLIKPTLEFSEDTAMVILNTLYLKDLWNNYGYDLNYTSNEYDFKNIDNSITKSKFLSGYYNQGRVYNEETFSHFYTVTNTNFKLKFIVPSEGYSIYDVFTKENIMKVTQMKDYNTFDHENKLQYQTKVIFPEYETSCDKVINELLKERFGIVDLFTEGVCDFSSISDVDMYCNMIRHISKLQVNKKGIEGAAVTIMEEYGEAMPSEKYKIVDEEFLVDKAFGLVLIDRYDIPVFSGIVTNI